jgi:hypothetical protein
MSPACAARYAWQVTRPRLPSPSLAWRLTHVRHMLRSGSLRELAARWTARHSTNCCSLAWRRTSIPYPLPYPYLLFPQSLGNVRATLLGHPTRGSLEIDPAIARVLFRPDRDEDQHHGGAGQASAQVTCASYLQQQLHNGTVLS